MHKKLLYILTLTLGFPTLLAQTTGGIIGVVTDATTGRELIGINIRVMPGGKSDVSDVEGRFLINGLAPGAYSVEFYGTNYRSTTIPIVKVVPAELTVLTVALIDSIKPINGVLITGKRITQGNVQGLANERKASANIVDGITADVIRRTPDRNTAEALRRVSGVSLQDNKFPVIRGLADRYNMALINGVPMPSTLPDKKAFAFDVIPSSFLDNILVTKTGIPENPGEFAGGIVQINTRDVPDESTQVLSLGFGTMSNTFGKSVVMQNNPGIGNFFGFGGQYRQLPTGMPSSQQYQSLTLNEKLTASKSFENDWGTKSKNALPMLQFQYANSSRFLFMNKETGMLLALSYSGLQKYNQVERNDYDATSLTKTFTDNQYATNIISGAMLNFSMKLNKYNKLSWRNMLSSNTNEENNLRTGTIFESTTSERSYNFYYLQNKYIGTQLAGEHFLRGNDIKVKWNVGLQNIVRNSPDNRRLQYTRPSDDTSYPFAAAISPTKSLTSAGKLYITNTENVQFAGYQFIKGFYGEKARVDVKFGGYHQFKNRDFSARVLSIVQHSPLFEDNLNLLSLDKIFQPENFKTSGYRYDEIFDGSYIYAGKQKLHAGYLMLDNVFGHFVRLTGGVRFEAFSQELLTSKGVTPIHVNLQKNSLLPSAALTFLLNPKSNLRFAYSKTVARPDFRETSPFQYFDFVNFVSVTGNDTLKTTDIQNFDFRLETFPGDGQSISIGMFYKNFNNPIEQTIRPVISGGYRAISFINSPNATCYGAEFEFRFKLNKLAAKLKNFVWFGNAAYIKSAVEVDGRTRQMQGQAPYLLNSGILYTAKKNKFTLSLNYNLVGPRIYSVGTSQYPDFFENQRHVLDLQIGIKIGKKGELKFNSSDIFANPFYLYQNKDNNTNLDKTKDRIMNSMAVGRMQLISYTIRLK